MTYDIRCLLEVKGDPNLGSRISRKWRQIESWYQQKIIIKSHMGFLKKLENLNFGDPEKSKSLTEILDAEYFVNGVGYRVHVNKELIGMHRLRIG